MKTRIIRSTSENSLASGQAVEERARPRAQQHCNTGIVRVSENHRQSGVAVAGDGHAPRNSHRLCCGCTRTVVAMLVSCLLGAAASATWFLIREQNRKPVVVIERVVEQQDSSGNNSTTSPQQAPVIPQPVPREPEPLDETVAAELVKLFPDFETQTLDQMATTLREKALGEFGNATVTMQETLAAAQKEMSAKAPTRAESDRAETVKQFQKLQQAQSAKLADITARLQQRIATLERMKGVTK